MPIKVTRTTIGVLVACFFSLHSFPAYSQNYLLDSGPVAPAVAINNNGQVVLSHYLYSNGALTLLPSGMCGTAINNSGDIAGVIPQTSESCGAPQGSVESTGQVAVYSGGVLTQYPAIGIGEVTGINDSGTVIGFTSTGNFLITNGTVSNPIGGCGDYWAINAASQIVSDSLVNQGGTLVPGVSVLSQGSCSFPSLSWGYAINATETVAGYSDYPNAMQNGYLQFGGVSGIANGSVTSSILDNTVVLYGINNNGFAVGDGNAVTGQEGIPTNNYHAFIYNGAVPFATDLNDFVLPTDPLSPYVTLQDGRGINDSGLVVANGTDSRTNVQHAYLLQVPLVWVGPAGGLDDFPSTPIGSTSVSQTATFTNEGSTTLTLGTTSSPANFKVQSTSCGASLAPSATCSVSIVYAPTSAGTPSGNVTLIAAGLPINVPVSGSSPVAVSLKASATTVVAGMAVTLIWTSPAGTSCTATGGAAAFGGLPPDGWTGNLGSSGNRSVTETLPNSLPYTYGITCSAGTESRSATVSVVVTSPLVTVNLVASPTTVHSGVPITLTWSSKNATNGCVGVGGGPNDGWAGAKLPANGSEPITEPLDVVTDQSETLTFTITCTYNNSQGPSASASVKVVQLDSPANSSSHGGGAFDWISLTIIFGVLVLKEYRSFLYCGRRPPKSEHSTQAPNLRCA